MNDSKRQVEDKVVKLWEELSRVKSAFDDGQIESAIEILSQAAEHVSQTSNISASDVFLWEKFGSHLILTGEIDQLLDLLPKMLQTYPWTHNVHSHMLFNLHHLPDIDQKVIFDEHKRWAKSHASVENAANFHDNIADPDRRLRIGYISPNFCMHPVAFFIEPLLDGHNRQNVEVFGYGNVAKPETATEHLKPKFDHYRNIYGLDSQSLVELIKDDKIDILVDLAGHTSHNSLADMAYKPAPIQVSYLGYPGTTGMGKIDYRLVDECVNPPESQKFYTEELVYLPEPFTCYSFTDLPIAVGAVEKNGYITFGSFKNNCKINSYVMSLWAQVLKANPGSHMLLRFARADDPDIKNHYLRWFERLGINADRIEIAGKLDYLEHLKQYQKVDICLDTFPFNGHTTTCEALWMGVPIISLTGESFSSRLGLSLLKSIGLEFFTAKTAEEYIAKATALAQNRESLAKIRATLRARIASSGLFDCKKFAAGLEAAYREMWRKWCQNRPRQIKQQGIPCKSAPATICNKKKAKRGIMYMIWGNDEKHEMTLQKAMASARLYHPELPIHVERFQAGGKINKTRICDLSPFEQTVFLDNDTIVMDRLDYGFEKAGQFGLACVINECPWARRYSDSRLTGDMVEYNSGVLFFTEKAKPVFKAWEKLFPTTDASIVHLKGDKNCLMPVADQGSLALAFEQMRFNPFVLPYNWNFRPSWYRSFFGPIKIWHGYYEIPEKIFEWNKDQTAENALIRFCTMDLNSKVTPAPAVS